jgi:predicted KAP-like P-loop ATPase
MILSDNETKIDLLNNEPIAKTIVTLLRERPEHPLTIGVHGDWGAGKSSVLEMIEAALEGDARVLCLKFNGWRFQGFEDAKIPLIEGIVTGLIEKRPTLTKATEALPWTFRACSFFYCWIPDASPWLLSAFSRAVTQKSADPIRNREIRYRYRSA